MGSSATMILGLVGVAVTCALAACSDEFPELPPAQNDDAGVELGDAGSSKSWDATYTVSPADAHPGDLLTLTFLVQADGSPASGLAMTASFEQAVGGTATGDFALSPGSDAGTYVGRHAFITAGTYRIAIEFEDEGTTVHIDAQPLVLEGH